MNDQNYHDEWIQCGIADEKVLIRCVRHGKPVGDRYKVAFACKGTDGNTKWKKCSRALEPDCLMVTLHETLEVFIKEERQKRQGMMTESLLTYIAFKKGMEERGIDTKEVR